MIEVGKFYYSEYFKSIVKVTSIINENCWAYFLKDGHQPSLVGQTKGMPTNIVKQYYKLMPNSDMMEILYG